MARPAESCTIELSTGRFLRVAQPLNEVAHRVQDAVPDSMLCLTRMRNTGGPEMWPDVYVRADQVVGIYPLDSKSEPGDLATVVIDILRPGDLTSRILEQARRFGFGGPQ